MLYILGSRYYQAGTMRKAYSTLTRTNRTIPQDEIRTSPTAINKLDWMSFVQMNRDVLECYYICINKILSRFTGTSISTIEEILYYEYFFKQDAIRRFIKFITTNETKDISFDEPFINIRKPILYRTPKVVPSTINDGAASTWVAPKKVSTDIDGEIKQ